MVITGNLLDKWRNRRQGGLLENTVMLYILQFSNMALGIVSRGIQTRTIDDKSIYGTLVVAQSVMVYFQLLMDFGFMFSAVGKISKHREDKAYLCRLLTCITLIKLAFLAVSFVVLLVFFAPNLSFMDFVVYVIFLIATALNSLLPDFMYRGLERMTTITVRAVSVKAFTTLMLFLFIHGNSDYWLVPLFTAVGNAGALLVVYVHLFKEMHIRFVRVRFREILAEAKESSSFFFSRIASTVYSTANTQVLVLADPTRALSSVYSNADYVVNTGRNCLSPISDSLYPHMVKHRNFRLIRKALLIFMPLILSGSAVVFFLAEPICVLLYGEGYADSAVALRALLPALIVTLPNYLLGFPTMSAMGIPKLVNLTTILGTVFHILCLAVLLLTGSFSLVSLCLLTGCTETFILLCRIFLIWKNREKMKADTSGAEVLLE